MDTRHGFELLREQDVQELRSRTRLFRHHRTGAEILSLSNDDENKVFGITFRTPPSDSTGVAHILEHSVLCGSRKYPVKEPFVELLKGSLQSFLNAFTYPDKTSYPVASQSLQDFYNLIDVYLDAVFYPRLTRCIFKQEGWHFEAESPDRPLRYKGVVFNEMKGAYSSPDNLLSEYVLQSLFPQSPYGYDSGGDPQHIPDLTFERFQAFHSTFYHPSNARIYFYGDDDPDERLRIINEYLEDFEYRDIPSSVPLQPPFDHPRQVVKPFNAGQGADAKGMVTLNWLLTETTGVEDNFALRMLEYMLLGMPASPLRKALIDSGLGEGLAGEGLGTELRQMVFSTGLKGMVPDNSEALQGLVLKTLEDLAEKGIDPRTVEAALNTIEFRLRENNPGHLPRGLVLMLRALTTWLYDHDPLALLAFEGPLNTVKSLARSKKGYFEGYIRRLFLDNPHRTTLILKPDPGLREREERAERERLAEARSAMTPAETRGVLEEVQELRRLQETPDSPEALATIPVLKISDLEKENKKIPLSVADHEGTPFLFHDLFTNGIVYVDVGLDLQALPARFIPYVPLFGRALVEMGTQEEDFVLFTQRISRETGGIRPRVFTSAARGPSKSAAWLFLRGKAMATRGPALIHLLHDMLLEANLDNRERFRQMVLEEKAREEQKLVPRGHQVVNLRLRSHFNEAHWAAEQMQGVSYLFFLRELARAVDENWPRVFADLEEIRQTLVNRRSMVINLTADQEGRSSLDPAMGEFLDSMKQGPAAAAGWVLGAPPPCEGMTIPAQVNYVGKGADLYGLGYRFHGSALVIIRYLRNTWLWDRIRVRGGAYGAFCLFDRLSGVLTLLSYRDPNLMDTLEVFDQTAQFLRETDLSREELTKGIIGAIGDLDAHMLPHEKGYVSMIRHLTQDSEEDRQFMRDQILATTKDHFRAFAQELDKVKDQGLVKVLGSPTALEGARSRRPDWMKTVHVL